MGLGIAFVISCLLAFVASIYAVTRVRGLVMQVKDLSSAVSALSSLDMLRMAGSVDDAPVASPSPDSATVDPATLAAAEDLLGKLGLQIEKD